MLRRPGAWRPRSIAKICLICIILSCIFIFASCTGNTTKKHDCTYGGKQLVTDGITNFRSTVENRNKVGTYTYYLGSNINLTTPLQIPEGTFVGICVDEFKITLNNTTAEIYTIVDTDGNASNNVGGVYFFDCSTHAIHSKVAYQYIEQNAFDFFGRSGASLYDAMGANQDSYSISINTDINIPASYQSLVIPEGKTLYVCTNGHKFNCSVDLESAGGRLAVFDCKQSGFHECLHLDDAAVGITQENMVDLSKGLTDAKPGDEIHVYLNSDIIWDGELAVPNGVTIVLCLNGHSATGSVKKGTYTVPVIDENGVESTETLSYGDFIVFDCSHHLCSGVCMTGEMLAINRNSITWTEQYLRDYIADPEDPVTVYCVLEDDISVPLIEGINFVVCVNGFKNRDNQWLTKEVGGEVIQTGGIIYYNCASSHSCEIASMVGLENKSILLDTADGVNQFLSQLGEVPEGSNAPLVAACFSLTADLKGSGEIAAPAGTYAILCLNGYSMGEVKVAEGGNVFIFECNREYCSEMKNDVISLDQGIVDLLAMYAVVTGSPYPFNSNYIFALTEDIVVPEGAFVIAEGCTVNFCLRGHTITGNESANGVITHKGCTHRTTPHLCAVSDMFGETSTALKAKSAGTVTSALSTLEAGVHFFHLTDNLTGTGEISAPAGAVVGICLDGYSKGEVKVAAGSNVFFYECGKHYCATEKVNIPTFDQGAFDLFTILLNGNPFAISNNTKIGVSEDVVIDAKVRVLDGGLLSICSCGHNVKFTDLSGEVLVHNDADGGSYKHYCAVPYVVSAGVSSTPLYAVDTNGINAIFARDAANGMGFYHLTSDIIGGELDVPTGFVAMICLNGFEMQDVKIPEGATVFIYECGMHYCEEVDMDIPAFDQGVFDFISVVLSNSTMTDAVTGETYRGIFLYENQMIALLGDVNVPFDIIVADGYALGFCTCGYKLTASEGVTFKNVYVHDTCGSDLADAQNSLDNAMNVVGGCAVCDRNAARPLNATTLREMIDEEGNVILPSGSYYYYLENDFQLTRMLVIPDGVDIHVCLHGYTLYSAYLWSDITTYGAGYPEYRCSALVVLDSGASFNLYDCSEKMTGVVSLKQFRLRDSNGNMKLAFDVVESDDSTSASSIQDLAVSLGTVMINRGTINIYGGNVYAITGILNCSGGVVNFYNGNMYALFAGVMNADMINDTEAYGSKIYIGEGATISSVYMGVYMMGGDIVLDGGTVNAGLGAIVDSTETTNSSVTINGGEINVGSSDRLMMAAMCAWSSIGGAVMDFSGVNLDLGADEYCGVATTGTLILNGDVNIVMGEMTVTKDPNDPKEVTDFYLIGGNSVIVNNVDDTYTVRLDGSINVTGDDEVFVPLNTTQRFPSDSGGTAIVPLSDDFVSYASVTDMSVSTEGAVKVNIYTEIDPAFVASGRVRFYVKYADGVHVYTIDDAERVVIDGVTKYKFSIYTAAKDYASTINCYFTLVDDPSLGINDPFTNYVGVCIGTQSLSIESYLNRVIANRAYGDSVIDIAKAMKNYCAAAAYHFEVSENYAVVEGMAQYLELVDCNILDQFKATQGEAYGNSPFIFKTATVVLKSETSLRIYFDLLEGFELERDENGNVWMVGVQDGKTVRIALTVTLMGSTDPIAFTVNESGVATRPYYIEIAGIYAKDYFNMLSVKVDGAVYMNYSVISWCRTVLNNQSKYDESVVDVARAMVLYGYTAVEYAISTQPTPPSDEGGTE